jgi:putative tRNA adenosine deaminase-associated protein
MWVVAYFTAVIARIGGAWRARDIEVDDVASLDDLADCLRSVASGDEPVLAVVEHEDEWFALVRVDGDELPRLFVSDLGAASHSHYGTVLAPAADVDVEEDDASGADDDESDDPADDGSGDEEAQSQDAAVAVAAWAGEPDLLEDLGVTGRTLRKLVEDNADDPGAVLAEVGESVGFADLLQALR